ncbi:MAG: hypothetical protein EBS53_16815 [Bacteroidetes bacterium]|nr:hypothetical protein [Bacteroidota bacterium]NBX73484.1 hypothetical protein [Alphaproteobacteria bacterium]
MIKTLIHYGHGHEQPYELDLVKNFALEYELEYRHEGISELSQKNIKYPIAVFWDFVNQIKYTNFVVIWNGMQCYGPLITKLCNEKNIPKCYIEWGMLPQSDNFFIDPLGFCGDSILNYDLSWINNSDIEYLYYQRSLLQSKYTIDDKNYILIPLQIENDSQILYYTKYKNMYEFIVDVIKEYPKYKIIIKTHPKNNFNKYFISWNDNYTKLVSSDRISIVNDKSISFMELAASSSLVIGLTSTTLYEAGILGKKIISIGKHPLNTTKNNIDKVLAGALVLNIDRRTGNLKSILDRFHIKPL